MNATEHSIPIDAMDFTDVSTYIVPNNILYGELFRQCDHKENLCVTDQPYIMEELSDIRFPLVSICNASPETKNLHLACNVYFIFRMDLTINNHCNPRGFRGFAVIMEGHFSRLEM
jgi:hypothetical protein